MTHVIGAAPLALGRAAISETRVSSVWSFGKDLGLVHCQKIPPPLNLPSGLFLHRFGEKERQPEEFQNPRVL